MITTTDLFKEKKFPEWFTTHPVFKEVSTIKKVFPGIGLPNCEEECQLDMAGPSSEAAKELVKAVENNINNRIAKLGKWIKSKPELSAARKTQGARCDSLLTAMSSLIKNKRKDFVKENNGRLTIKLPVNVMIDGDVRPVFRDGESLFRVYNKLNESLVAGKFAKMTKLEDLPAFKVFSTENVPNSKFKVVFGSDGANGAWDVATMSMRGVVSCQSWGTDAKRAGGYSHCTIGSVIDPFVGIIYLTSGMKSSEFGSRMIRRCVVRFVINGKENKPYLLLDNMYPSQDTKIITQFKNFLKKKTGGKFEVVYASGMDQNLLKDTYMPLTELRKLLRETKRDGTREFGHERYDLETISSYQDIRITDKVSNKNDSQSVLFEKNVEKKTAKFITDFAAAFTSAVKEVDVEQFPNSLQTIAKKLKGNDKRYFSFSYMIPYFSNPLANAIIDSVDINEFTSSDLFMRRVYYSYFNNKSKIINDVKIKITREMNGKLQLKEKERMRSENFINFMKAIMPKLDEVMKVQLKELVSNQKAPEALPIP